ncbi:MAG: CDP-alcohol phosphatidyltransferase family protein [Candidatus Aminicenantales bacterium]
MKTSATAVIPSKWLTLPNILTAFRLILVPFFLRQMLLGRKREALLIFLLAGLTDLLDGFVARTWNLRSPVGRILDPAADKLLLVAAFIAASFPHLSWPFHVPVWLVATVIGRDTLIASGAVVLYFWKGTKTFSPSLWGKICTFFQVLTILFILAANALTAEGLESAAFRGFPWRQLHSLFFALTFVATVISGLQYTIFGLKKALFSSS